MNIQTPPLNNTTLPIQNQPHNHIANRCQQFPHRKIKTQIHHSNKITNNLPHEADVHAETAMNGGAIDAEEDPIRDGRPGRVLRIAIETHLKKQLKKRNKISEIKRRIADLKPDLVNQKP